MGFDFARLRARLLHGVLGLGILGVACAGVALAYRFPAVLDWTGNQRHSLSPASIAALAAVPGQISVSAYLPGKHLGRATAKALIARYQLVAPGLSLRFVDPVDVPDLMRKEELRVGEMVVAVGERRERVREMTEAALTDALARLARGEQQWLGFVTGHGERSPTRQANFDWSEFAGALASRGIRARELNLAEAGAVPDNLSALVLASPQMDFLPGELALLQGFVARGGHLLWLLEPAVPASLATLASALGLQAVPQTVVDPAGQSMGLSDPSLALVLRYEAHAALGQFSATTLFPHATPVTVRTPDGWTATTLFRSGKGSWGETGPVAGAVSFDEGKDARGPLPLGVALSRGAQRVVLVGDGDFLSNTYLGNGGNRELGIRLVEWLSANDRLIKVDAVPAPDRELVLSSWQIALIAGGFLVVLPGVFLLNGLWLWWRRRA